MRRISRAVLVGIAAGLAGTSAQAVLPASGLHSFSAISSRNVFGLRPPQQLIATNAPVVLPKLILEGITTILGNKRALLKEEPPAQPGHKAPTPAEAVSMILTEGQRQGDIEVLQIDEKAGSVKVNNSGTIMNLTFEKDGEKVPSRTLRASHPATAGWPPRFRFPGHFQYGRRPLSPTRRANTG